MSLITDINEIPPQINNHQDQHETSIPNKFKERLKSVIIDMEKELDISFSINIRQAGKNPTEIPLNDIYKWVMQFFHR